MTSKYIGFCGKHVNTTYYDVTTDCNDNIHTKHVCNCKPCNKVVIITNNIETQTMVYIKKYEQTYLMECPMNNCDGIAVNPYAHVFCLKCDYDVKS